MNLRPPRAQFLRLRAAYEAGFEQWSSQVYLLRSLAARSAGGGTAIHEARELVAKAQITYRQSRDVLAEFMLAGTIENIAR
jgi:hypothetical protein